jgi:hypothetical protein
MSGNTSVSVGLRDSATETVSNANRDTVLALGPIQPRTADFPGRLFGSRMLRFQPSWYKYEWLEYSTSLDAILCFYCRCYGSLGKNFIATYPYYWGNEYDRQ